MEKTEVTLSFETEKLEALALCLQKKGDASLQKELGKVLEKLYEEKVPQEVKDFIEWKMKRASAKPRPKPAPKTNEKEDTVNGG